MKMSVIDWFLEKLWMVINPPMGAVCYPPSKTGEIKDEKGKKKTNKKKSENSKKKNG